MHAKELIRCTILRAKLAVDMKVVELLIHSSYIPGSPGEQVTEYLSPASGNILLSVLCLYAGCVSKQYDNYSIYHPSWLKSLLKRIPGHQKLEQAPPVPQIGGHKKHICHENNITISVHFKCLNFLLMTAPDISFSLPL